MGSDQIYVGATAQHSFVVTDEMMDTFRRMSGDTSLIHSDEEFCRARGFSGPIVYGGLMLMNLSHMVGELLPGKYGTSVGWSITYRNPLYVGEEAVLELTVKSISKGAGLVDASYTITSGGKRIAQGKTQSMVPTELLSEDVDL